MLFSGRLNSPVSNSSRLLNRSTEDSFIQGWPRPVECTHVITGHKREKVKKRQFNLALKTYLQGKDNLLSNHTYTSEIQSNGPGKNVKKGKLNKTEKSREGN